MSRVAFACALLLLAGCASHKPRQDTSSPPPSRAGSRGSSGAAETSRPQAERYRDEHDGGPAQPAIDVATLVEPTPKVEPRARYGNNPNYSVLGKDYHVVTDSRGYVERGIASWYGNKFHGYMTSSLEPYDMYQFSAAHKTLPLPTYARVTNLDNGKSVVVRINDRGPFHENRLIDLSYAAAVRIGIWPKGTGLVEVRAIDPAHPDATPAPLPKTVTAEAASARIYLQLGAFGDRANADRVASAARKGGIDKVDVEAADVNGRTVHRVRVGPLADVAAADALAPRIESLGLGAPRVAIER
jgi:rare lipoprotein A